MCNGQGMWPPHIPSYTSSKSHLRLECPLAQPQGLSKSGEVLPGVPACLGQASTNWFQSSEAGESTEWGAVPAQAHPLSRYGTLRSSLSHSHRILSKGSPQL